MAIKFNLIVSKKLLALHPKIMKTCEYLANGNKGVRYDLKERTSKFSIYGARANQADRLLLIPTIYRIYGKDYPVLVPIEFIENHRYDKSIIRPNNANHKINKSVEKLLKEFKLEKNTILDTSDFEFIGSPNFIEAMKGDKDNIQQVNIAQNQVHISHEGFIILDEQQLSISSQKLPLLILGNAGAGKTSILNIILENCKIDNSQEGSLVYLTKNPRLIQQNRNSREQIENKDDSTKNIEYLKPEEFFQLYFKINIKEWANDNEALFWITRNKKSAGLANLTAEDIFIEFKMMSACDDETAYEQLGSKKSVYAQTPLQSQLWKLYESFRKNCKHLDFIYGHDELQLAKPLQLLGIDEGQQFTPGAIKFLKQICNNQIVIAADHRQALDAKRSVLSTVRDSVIGKDNTYYLRTNHRNSQMICETIIKFDTLRRSVQGPYSKDETKFEAKPNSEQGSINFLLQDSKDDSILDKFISDENTKASYVVITTEDYVKEASEKFNGFLVLTTDQIPGLQFENIIYYKPFANPEFKKINQHIHQYGVEDKENLSKNYSDINFDLFNKIYLGFSRAQKNLVIVDDISRNNNCIYSYLRGDQINEPSLEYKANNKEISQAAKEAKERINEALDAYAYDDSMQSASFFKPSHPTKATIKKTRKKAKSKTAIVETTITSVENSDKNQKNSPTVIIKKSIKPKLELDQKQLDEATKKYTAYLKQILKDGINHSIPDILKVLQDISSELIPKIASHPVLESKNLIKIIKLLLSIFLTHAKEEWIEKLTKDQIKLLTKFTNQNIFDYIFNPYESLKNPINLASYHYIQKLFLKNKFKSANRDSVISSLMNNLNNGNAFRIYKMLVPKSNDQENTLRVIESSNKMNTEEDKIAFATWLLAQDFPKLNSYNKFFEMRIFLLMPEILKEAKLSNKEISICYNFFLFCLHLDRIDENDKRNILFLLNSLSDNPLLFKHPNENPTLNGIKKTTPTIFIIADLGGEYFQSVLDSIPNVDYLNIRFKSRFFEHHQRLQSVFGIDDVNLLENAALYLDFEKVEFLLNKGANPIQRSLSAEAESAIEIPIMLNQRNWNNQQIVSNFKVFAAMLDKLPTFLVKDKEIYYYLLELVILKWIAMGKPYNERLKMFFKILVDKGLTKSEFTKFLNKSDDKKPKSKSYRNLKKLFTAKSVESEFDVLMKQMELKDSLKSQPFTFFDATENKESSSPRSQTKKTGNTSS